MNTGRLAEGRRRWARTVTTFGLAVVFALAAASLEGCDDAGHAAAEGARLYDTTRVLRHLGNECMGTPNCQTIGPSETEVGAGKTGKIVVKCPGNLPFITGWDTEQHEHLTASLAPVAAASAGVAPGDGQQLTVLVANNADAPGVIKVFLGCAAQAPKTTAVRKHRGAVPSNHGAGPVGDQ